MQKILSYWIAERIQSAQPEPDPYSEEVDMAESEYANPESILSYWTPKRIVSAEPEPYAYGEHIVEADDYVDEATDADVHSAGPLSIVPDSVVKTFPYQSVGKLMYTKVGPSSSRDSFSTAYVVLNSATQRSVILTSAHSLEKGNEVATNLLFIPGYIPPSTQPFGIYPQIPGDKGVAWSVDPNWNPKNVQVKYDMGMVKLDKGSTGKYVHEVVMPIQLLSNQTYDSSSEWNSIGYPVKNPAKNPNGKMAQRSGTFYREENDEVYKYGIVEKGMSGSPWIKTGTNSSSNGITAGNSKTDPAYAMTPYIRSTTDELVKLYFKV